MPIPSSKHDYSNHTDQGRLGFGGIVVGVDSKSCSSPSKGVSSYVNAVCSIYKITSSLLDFPNMQTWSGNFLDIDTATDFTLFSAHGSDIRYPKL